MSKAFVDLSVSSIVQPSRFRISMFSRPMSMDHVESRLTPFTEAPKRHERKTDQHEKGVTSGVEIMLTGRGRRIEGL